MGAGIDYSDASTRRDIKERDGGVSGADAFFLDTGKRERKKTSASAYTNSSALVFGGAQPFPGASDRRGEKRGRGVQPQYLDFRWHIREWLRLESRTRTMERGLESHGPCSIF